MIRRFFDTLRPHFEEKGKLHVLFPLYEALDTFFYTPGTVTRAAAHIRDGLDLKRMMTIVVVALIPCMFMAMWNTGYQANTAIAERTGTTPTHPIPLIARAYGIPED